MIEVEALTRRFGQFTAVDALSFSVPRGQVLGFLGPNGAGKTTTMKMLSGFLRPTAGTARVFGHDVVSDSLAARRQLGYLPEGAPLYADMRVGALLRFIARLRGYRGNELETRVMSASDRLELGSVLRQRIDTLSKGFRRRVGIAQAILHDPPALILDEPTDGLDPNQKHQVRNLIKELASDRIVIISTHILEEVDAVCDRALIINRGRLVADDTPTALARRSRYHEAVTVETDDVERVAARLRERFGAASIETSGQRVTVVGGGAAALATVRELLADGGQPPPPVWLEHGRLDDVFRTLTRGEAA